MDLPTTAGQRRRQGETSHPTRLWSRRLLRGQLVKLYILCYLVYRFGTEFIRPEARLAFGLTGYQWAALVLIAMFTWLWIRDARQAPAMTQMAR